MNAISSLSARQLRRAAEIKEEIESLENRLKRLVASADGGIRVVPGYREGLRTALKAGILAAVGRGRAPGWNARARDKASNRQRREGEDGRRRNVTIEPSQEY
ncbi:MAG: hypothetical protein ACREFR_01560 [Limisphaerales bacterium]